jgi:tetratricopeptide (TPR) repeat protein
MKKPVSSTAYRSPKSLISAVMLVLTLTLQTLFPVWKASANSEKDPEIAYGDSEFCQADRIQLYGPMIDQQFMRFSDEFTRQNYATAISALFFMAEITNTLPNSNAKIERLSPSLLPDPNSDELLWSQRLATIKAAGQTEQMIAILDKALQILQEMPPDSLTTLSRDMRPRLLVTLARHYQALGESQKALSTVDLARKILPQQQDPEGLASTFLVIAETYFRLGEVNTSQEILKLAEAEAKKVTEPDETARTQQLAEVGRHYAQIGDFASARRISQALKDIPINQSQLDQAIATQYLNRNQPQQAISVANAIQEPRFKAATLGEIAHYYATQANNPAQANTLFTRAIQLLQGQSTLEDQLVIVLEKFAQFNPDAALPLINQLSAWHLKLSPLSQTAVAYAQAGEAEKTTQVLSQIQTELQPLDPDLNRFYITQVIETAMQSEQYAFAFQVASALSTNLDPAIQSGILRQTMIPTLIEKNELTLLRQVVDVMVEDTMGLKTTEGLAPLAAAYVQNNQIEAALALATIPTPSHYHAFSRSVEIRAVVARELALVGKSKDSQALFTAIQAEITAIPDTYLKTTTLGKLILEQAKAKQPVSPDLKQLLANSAKTLIPINRESALMDLLNQLTNLNQLTLALEFTLLLDPTESTLRESLLSSLSEIAHRQGQFLFSLRAIDALQSPVSKVIQYISLAEHAAFSGIQPYEILDLIEPVASVAISIPGPENNTIPLGNDQIPIEDGFDRGSLLERIAMLYILIGSTEKARETVTLLQDPAARGRILNQRFACYGISAQ